jgi:hypothetical protein
MMAALIKSLHFVKKRSRKWFRLLEGKTGITSHFESMLSNSIATFLNICDIRIIAGLRAVGRYNAAAKSFCHRRLEAKNGS